MDLPQWTRKGLKQDGGHQLHKDGDRRYINSTNTCFVFLGNVTYSCDLLLRLCSRSTQWLPFLGGKQCSLLLYYGDVVILPYSARFWGATFSLLQIIFTDIAVLSFGT